MLFFFPIKNFDRKFGDDEEALTVILKKVVGVAQPGSMKVF